MKKPPGIAEKGLPMPDQDQNPMAEAMQWVSKITTVCFMFALPPIGGSWLDNWLGCMPLFTFCGLILGMGGGLWQLIQITKVPKKD